MPIPDELTNQALIAIVFLVVLVFGLCLQLTKMVLDRLTKSFAEEARLQREHDTAMIRSMAESSKEQAQSIANSVKEGFQTTQAQAMATATQIIDALKSLSQVVSDTKTETQTVRTSLNEQLSNLHKIPQIEQRIEAVEKSIGGNMETILDKLDRLNKELLEAKEAREQRRAHDAKLDERITNIEKQVADLISQIASMIKKED